MSLKRKIISALTVGTAIIAFSSFISAQETKTEQPTQPQKQERREMRGGRFGKFDGEGRKMRRGRFGKRGMMHGLRGLNLSDDQKTQIRTIMQSRRGSDTANREEMRTIMSAKRAGTITPEQQTKLEAFKAAMKENATRTREQVLAVLTPEQRTQLETRKAEMKRKREERRQMRDQNKPVPAEKKDND